MKRKSSRDNHEQLEKYNTTMKTEIIYRSINPKRKMKIGNNEF